MLLNDAGAYAHCASEPESGPPKGGATIFTLEEKYATWKGAAPQHSESETLYPLPKPATSARPRPSFFQREWTEKRSPLVVLCTAKSRSPPPTLSLA